MSDWDAEEELSEAERELAELELEYAGINEGFKRASEKLNAINNLLEKHKLIRRAGRFYSISTLIRSSQARRFVEDLMKVLEDQPSGGIKK